MKDEIKEIIVRQIENKENEYFAYYKSDFMQATYSIFFNDTILGAVALNRFYEMIKSSFDIKNLNLTISYEKIKFQNKAILDEITRIESTQNVKVEVLQ